MGLWDWIFGRKKEAQGASGEGPTELERALQDLRNKPLSASPADALAIAVMNYADKPGGVKEELLLAVLREPASTSLGASRAIVKRASKSVQESTERAKSVARILGWADVMKMIGSDVEVVGLRAILRQEVSLSPVDIRVVQVAWLQGANEIAMIAETT